MKVASEPILDELGLIQKEFIWNSKRSKSNARFLLQIILREDIKV